LRRFTTIFAFLASLQTAGAVERERPAANMRVIGPPRIAWLELDKRRQSQERLEARLIKAFDRCIPVPLTKNMSLVTPGNVLYFRFGAAPGRGQHKSRPVFNGPID